MRKSFEFTRTSPKKWEDEFLGIPFPPWQAPELPDLARNSQTSFFQTSATTRQVVAVKSCQWYSLYEAQPAPRRAAGTLSRWEERTAYPHASEISLSLVRTKNRRELEGVSQMGVWESNCFLRRLHLLRRNVPFKGKLGEFSLWGKIFPLKDYFPLKIASLSLEMANFPVKWRVWEKGVFYGLGENLWLSPARENLPQAIFFASKDVMGKKVFLCSKKVLRRKKAFWETSGNLLRTHFLSKKVSEPSPLLCSPPPCVFKRKHEGKNLTKCRRATRGAHVKSSSPSLFPESLA